MIEIGLGVLFFTGIVMVLVVLILITRSWLIPSGAVVFPDDARIFVYGPNGTGSEMMSFSSGMDMSIMTRRMSAPSL
jgi:Na+-transporting NADH:ubiquinone oxidoreductase subunit NqrF